MYNITIGEKEYALNCKLGVTIAVKSAFKKSFMEVISDIEKLDIDELCKLVHCGVTDGTSLSDFQNECYDNLGMMELYEIVQLFVKKIQFPNLTEEEIDKKLEEKKSMTETGKSTT